MRSFQEIIKSYRESKGLNLSTAADAINIPEETIILIEQGDNCKITEQPSAIVKDKVKRYCEYLSIPENYIRYIINSIDILYYKKARYGKMKPFDYFNRVAIVGISLLIIYLSTNIVIDRFSNTHSQNNQSNDKNIDTLATTRYENFIQESQPLLNNKIIDNLPITPKDATPEQTIDSKEIHNDNSPKIIEQQVEKSANSTIKSENKNGIDNDKTILEKQESIVSEENQDHSNPITKNNESNNDTKPNEPAPIGQVSNKSYIIKPGDSLYKIAQMVSDDIDNQSYSNYDLILSIKGLNLKDDPDIINDTIFAGEELNIPATEEQIKNGIEIYKQYSNK